MADFKNEFSWSKSRDEMFKDCKRKYYYNYYGYWDGWKDFVNERKKKLNYLKRLKTKEIWVGENVHKTIEFILNKLKIGEEVTLPNALSILRTKMEAEYNESLSKKYTGFHSKLIKLFGHEYEDTQLTKEKKEEMMDLAARCIVNFFNSDTFLEIKQTPIKDWVLLEEFLKFTYKGETIFLSIDFAIRKGEEIILYDWKTGKSDFIEPDLQLSLYSMYIAERFNIDPKNITAKIYNVATNEEKPFVINEKRVEEIKEYIDESIKEMKNKLTDKENNTAEEENFEKNEGSRCRRCNFRKVCLEGW